MSSGPNWRRLDLCQPYLELNTKLRFEGQTEVVDAAGESCREALIYNIGDLMDDLVGYVEEDYDPTPWKQKKKLESRPGIKEKIQLDVEALRQAECTKLSMGSYDDDGDLFQCRRECCVAGLDNALNTLVSLPALLLNPDRYTGDWWEQTDAQIVQGNNEDVRIEYWGADNSILQHPALVSIMFGLFRQAVVLHQAGQLVGLSKAAPPADVRAALINSDEKAALKLVQKARPWLFHPGVNTYFPLSGPGKWELFINLHKALYQHGFESVFGNISAAWSLASRGIKVLNGSHSYFRDKRAAESVRKLAKKAA